MSAAEKLSLSIKVLATKYGIMYDDLRVIEEAAHLLKAVEDAPEGHVDMLCAKDAVVVDELPEYFVNRINKKRVKLVEVRDGGS
ncbi:hypothetical protein [Pseudoxanthomonas winnipegensis]|uniref:hypothetical protein n=1 Tax=Pseudoxanthomonas winnipegensis TaxID=2480810 RepID=UPI00102D99B0|nr:hypothetical protein [Pseudoxanthomonas winnipegensis]RZZ85640.1 hypothetical protein EA663_11555 [Pseudoxanthomonas winnipegensis]